MNVRRRSGLLALLGAAFLLCSCGQPGAPQPPELEVPRLVSDLQVSRQGDVVTLRWSVPSRYTNGRAIRKASMTNICRNPKDHPFSRCTILATIDTKAVDPSGQREVQEFEDHLSGERSIASVQYGVEVLNQFGRSAGLSNQVEISLAPSLPAPSGLSAKVQDDGVLLQWEPSVPLDVPGAAYVYEISRKLENGPFAVIANVPSSQETYLDQSFPWEKNLAYRIAVVTQASATGKSLVEGFASGPIQLLPHDVFPPAQPKELQAVFSGPGQEPFVDLAWSPDMEPDLGGYYVYRREQTGEWVRLNDKPVTAPAFRDKTVQAGHTYAYAVSAVDVRNNESMRSAPASESVPEQ